MFVAVQGRALLLAAAPERPEFVHPRANKCFSFIFAERNIIHRLLIHRDEHYGWQLYQSDPSGNYGGWKAVAIGNGHAAAQNLLKTEFKEGLAVGEVRLAAPPPAAFGWSAAFASTAGAAAAQARSARARAAAAARSPRPPTLNPFPPPGREADGQGPRQVDGLLPRRRQGGARHRHARRRERQGAGRVAYAWCFGAARPRSRSGGRRRAAAGAQHDANPALTRIRSPHAIARSTSRCSPPRSCSRCWTRPTRRRRRTPASEGVRARAPLTRERGGVGRRWSPCSLRRGGCL